MYMYIGTYIHMHEYMLNIYIVNLVNKQQTINGFTMGMWCNNNR
jgi:hypothetical protein